MTRTRTEILEMMLLDTLVAQAQAQDDARGLAAMLGEAQRTAAECRYNVAESAYAITAVSTNAAFEPKGWPASIDIQRTRNGHTTTERFVPKAVAEKISEDGRAAFNDGIRTAAMAIKQILDDTAHTDLNPTERVRAYLDGILEPRP